MEETLLQKAQRLGIKPSGESLLQKAQRLGIKPTGVNAQGKFTLTETTEDTQNKIAQYQAQAEKSKKEADKLSSPLGMATSFVKNLGSNIASSEVALANTISGIANTKNLKYYNQNITDLTDINLKTLKQIEDYQKVGKDATQLKKQYNQTKSLIDENVNKIKELQGGVSKTTGQVLGEIGGTTLDLLTAGSYGNATKGLKTGVLGSINAPGVKSIATAVSPELGQISTQKAGGLFTKTGLGNILKGGSIGYGYDVSQNLQEGKTGIEAMTPGLGTLIGGGLPFISESGKTISDIKSGKIKQNYVKSIESDWNRIGQDYVKSEKVLEKSATKGKNPTSFLAERNIVPQDLIEGGKFNTDKVASNLINEKVPVIEDVLDKSLDVVQQGQPPLKVSDLEKKATSSIFGNLTPRNKEIMIENIKEEFAAIRRKYGETITLPQINSEKKIYWGDTGFDLTRPLKKDVNAQIGRTFKTAIEDNVKDVNIKELNNVVGNYYNAVDFLRTIDNKVPKVTLKQKAGRAITKGITTTIGSALGNWGGGVGGYLMGNSVSQALEGMSNPLRGYFLRNLKVTNPKAFNDAIKFLNKSEIDKLTRLALPQPSKLGSVKNPIITPPRYMSEGPAKKVLPYSSYPISQYKKPKY